MDVTTLDREVYSVREAADILELAPSTLQWWLDGEKRGEREYQPVIRPERTGSHNLTWAEFVEAGLLRQYRKIEGVKLQEIRAFINALREQEGVPYPLAHYRPWIGEGRHLLLKLQKKTNLPGMLWLVAPVNNQLVLTGPAESFLRRVDWVDDLAAAWRPHQDERSPVRCQPTSRFGKPAIAGISTEAIVEHLEGGEDRAEVAEQFDLSPDDVAWAEAYELSRRSAA